MAKEKLRDNVVSGSKINTMVIRVFYEDVLSEQLTPAHPDFL